MSTLKLINYRGGIARFYLPSSWVEEYEPAGGGTFYDDKPDSGTLRINVIGAEKASTANKIETAGELIAQITETNSVKQLPSGAAIAHAVKTGREDGKNLLIYRWHIGVPISRTYVRIIMFTYTILAAQESDPTVRQEIAMLNRLISEGEYPAVRGASGDYVPE